MTSETIKLIVAAGVHRGAQVELGLGSVLSLGRDIENDIVLSDLPDIQEAEHLRLGFTEPGRVEIYAIGDVVTVEGVQLSRGDAISAPLPAQLSLGSVELSLAAGRTAIAVAPQKRAGFWQKIKAPLQIGAPALALLIMSNASATTEVEKDLSGHSNLSFGFEAAAFDLTEYTLNADLDQRFAQADLAALDVATDDAFRFASRSLQTASLDPSAGVSDLKSDTPESAERYLAERLKALKLDGIDLSFEGQVITASGQLSAEDRASWQEIAPDLDQAFDSQYILITDFTDKVVTAEMPERPTAIWLSQDPYFVDRSGARWHQGDTTPAGWTVVSIDFSGVQVQQGERQVLIPLDLDGQR